MTTLIENIRIVSETEFRDQLIAAAVSRQVLAVHSMSGEDHDVPCVVVGRVIKVTQRTLVVEAGKFDQPIPIACITRIDPLGATPSSTEAA